MYIETMREMYNNVTKVLVDTTKSNSLLYLPLDKIVAQVNAESAQAAGSTVNPTNPPTPNASVTVGGASSTATTTSSSSTASSSSATSSTNNADKRDGLRSRDRESR